VLTPEKYNFCEQQQTPFSGCNATQTLGSNCRASFYPNFPNSLRIYRPSLWISDASKMRSKFLLLTLQRQTNARLYFCTRESFAWENKPSNITTSRLLHCPNGRRLLLNTFDPRWRRSAVGGPIPPRASWAPSQVAMRSPKSVENILRKIY
jgi:hypothetical protein